MAKKMSEAFIPEALYCSRCGRKRPPFTHPCPDCGDVQYSVVPNVQHTGWLRRNAEAEAKEKAGPDEVKPG